jgi:hypothetical protein
MIPSAPFPSFHPLWPDLLERLWKSSGAGAWKLKVRKHRGLEKEVLDYKEARGDRQMSPHHYVSLQRHFPIGQRGLGCWQPKGYTQKPSGCSFECLWDWILLFSWCFKTVTCQVRSSFYFKKKVMWEALQRRGQDISWSPGAEENSAVPCSGLTHDFFLLGVRFRVRSMALPLEPCP